MAPSAGGDPVATTNLSAPDMRERLETLASVLSCKDAVVISDELTFYDEAVGEDCYLPDGEVVFVRVYRSSASVAQNLVDWEPTLDSRREALWADHWYVVGPPTELARFPRSKGQIGPSRKLPTPLPLTPREEELTTCGRFMASAVRAFIFSPDDYAGNDPAFERAFPGANTMISSVLTPELLRGLRLQNEEKVMASAPDLLPELKALCLTAPKSEVTTQ